MNAELAKRRALSVRAALLTAGVADASLNIKQPEQMPNDANLAEARRVDVVIQP
jgi:outer membrane protein OmpA-like peptidoglycan-associated protein